MREEKFFKKLISAYRQKKLCYLIKKNLACVFKIIKILFILLFNPHLFPFAKIWMGSFIFYDYLIKIEAPYLNFKAIKWLNTYLGPSMEVFEYGSGGSTLFIAKRVKRLVSVEHDKYWFEKINSKLANKKITNCEYIYSPPDKLSDAPALIKNYTSELMPGYSFEKYVKIIDKFPDKSFDFILIDGRARNSCIKQAVKKVRSGGFIMLDNSDRSRYAQAEELLFEYKIREFCDYGPISMRKCLNSIWQIK